MDWFKENGIRFDVWRNSLVTTDGCTTTIKEVAARLCAERPEYSLRKAVELCNVWVVYNTEMHVNHEGFRMEEAALRRRKLHCDILGWLEEQNETVRGWDWSSWSESPWLKKRKKDFLRQNNCKETLTSSGFKSVELAAKVLVGKTDAGPHSTPMIWNGYVPGDDGRSYQIWDHPRYFITDSGQRLALVHTYNTLDRLDVNGLPVLQYALAQYGWKVDACDPRDVNYYWDLRAFSLCWPYMTTLIFRQQDTSSRLRLTFRGAFRWRNEMRKAYFDDEYSRILSKINSN
jgi:hypothetical protein